MYSLTYRAYDELFLDRGSEYGQELDQLWRRNSNIEVIENGFFRRMIFYAVQKNVQQKKNDKNLIIVENIFCLIYIINPYSLYGGHF